MERVSHTTGYPEDKLILHASEIFLSLLNPFALGNVNHGAEDSLAAAHFDWTGPDLAVDQRAVLA